MKRKRALSTESKIYHRAGCRYVKKIKTKNRMDLTPYEAKQYGYRPCKCCNSMAYMYDMELSTLHYYKRKYDMDFCIVSGIVYIKTNISCWKLIYSRKEEKIALYHRNNSDSFLNFEHPENEKYHRQVDCANSKTISALCKYIYEHDRFREAQKKGIVLKSFTSERSRILAARTQRKETRRRLDSLFTALEQNNEGYRELSFC